MNTDKTKNVLEWMQSKPEDIDINSEHYCRSRDIFAARLSSMMSALLKENISEELVYTLLAIVGEIGNNSYDHNIGNWPDLAGIFFDYFKKENKLIVVLADRGVGVKTTLKRVKPEIKDDIDALQIAFTERISGRAPENRGNGLKYVKNNISAMNMRLEFYSGNAKATASNNFKVELSEKHHNGCIAIISANL